MRKCLKFFKPLKLGIKKESTGVGLSIVQKIIEEMEGLFASKKQRCKFYFTIPKNKNNGVRKKCHKS
jgi:nitrogen-specific signal transduction histidine kinase